MYVHLVTSTLSLLIIEEENNKAGDDISSQAVVYELLVTRLQKSKPVINALYY